MKINTIVDIFRGNLLNTPYISYINEIKIDSTLIKQGDLFVALDSKDISTAIDNNAYAVIFDDNNIQIDDDEIAWIKVKDIKKALFNYLRMYLLENKKELFFITPFQKDILSQFNLKNISIIEIDTYFENIVNDKQFLFTTNLELIEKISKSFTNYNDIITNKFEIINYTVFETTIKYKDNIISRIKVPKFLIKELFILVNIFETIDIEINLNDIKFSEYFNPIFIDENLSKKEFGKTQNVIMLNKDFFYAKKEKEFLNNFKWAKVLLVSDKYLDKNNENEYEETIKYLSSIDNIVKYLKSNSFNFIIYYGDNRKKLENIINSKPIENTLF